MTDKQYEIPYNDDTKSWEMLDFSARVVNAANAEVQNIKPEIRVEDSPNGGYAAIRNNVLIVENTSVQQRIESGDHAQITLRLNDGDPKIGEILQRNSRFQLKVTMYPEFDAKSGQPEAAPIPVEGLTEIIVQLPQTWELTFKKAFWADAGVIDLKEVESVSQADLRDLGERGGRLILKPKGLFAPKELGLQIRSNNSIAHAGVCTLNRGEGIVLNGAWVAGLDGYVFEIQASRSEVTAQAGDLTLDVDVGMMVNHDNRMLELMRAAKKVSGSLGQEVFDRAKTFIQGYMDLIARETEEALVERKRDLTLWLLNIPRFIEYTKESLRLFDKSLKLFDEAYKRFVGNMINFTIELTFALFEVIKWLKGRGAGAAKEAVEKATKEMVEETAEKASRELLVNKESAEKALKVLEDQYDNISRELGETVYNPPPQPSKSWLQRIKKLRQQQLSLGEKLASQSKDVANVDANLKMASYIKENSADFTTKEFRDKAAAQLKEIPNSDEIQNLMKNLQAIRDSDIENLAKWGPAIGQEIAKLPKEAQKELRKEFHTILNFVKDKDYVLKLETLSNFNTGLRDDLLIKGPIGQKMQKISQDAQEAKKSAEKIRYKHVPFKHYEGWLAPLWFSMDWMVEQIAWLYDLAKEWIPYVAELEELLVWAIELFLGYMMKAINAMVDFMNSTKWLRSSIKASMRSQGVQLVNANGARADFFKFPVTIKEIPKKSRPEAVVKLANSASEKKLAKENLRSFAEGGYQKEKANQHASAKVVLKKLCLRALDIDHLIKPGPEQITANTANNVWRKLLGPMVQYEGAFNSAGKAGTDYVLAVPSHFAKNSTFQDWDGAIEWLAWSAAWILRLGGLIAVGTGYGAVFVAPAFVAAGRLEQAAALLRPIVSWLGTVPDVVGLQFDVLISTALMYTALIEGGVNVDEMVIESYYVE